MSYLERLRSPFIHVGPLSCLASTITPKRHLLSTRNFSFCRSLQFILLPHVIFPTTSDSLSCALQFFSQAHQPSHRHRCTLGVLVDYQ